MDDSSDESVDSMDARQSERQAALGFRPQSEIWCNRHLPYAEKLDEESQQMLRQIKTCLGKAVAMREMNPAVGIYTSKLMAYIKMYGLKFSKEDHVKFIKLFLDMICIPYLETTKLAKFCVLLTQLFAKPHLLSPDDLQVDWRPLYNLSKIILNKNCNKGVMFRFFSSLESNLQYVIQCCAYYFPKSSTREILDELYPQLEPLDTGKDCAVLDLLGIFLNPYEGHELWLDNFMKLWNMYHNPSWNVDIMNLVASTASHNIGGIDWEPYLPVMFTRILRSVDLPVVYKNIGSSRNQHLWASSVSMWIVSILGPKSTGQKYLDKFMGTIESYLHPANSGKWVHYLSDILVQLVKYFEGRLIAERYRKPSWMRRVPEEHRLTEECVTAFVVSMKPVAFQVMYSRVGSSDVSKVFKLLADLRPELIIPGVIERVYATLDSLTEPHKLTAALQCFVSVARPLVSCHNGYSEGRTHVIPILMATLPGIDPNDFKKTSVVLQFLTSFALMVPIVDCSKASLHYNDLTEEERLICEQTADLEDFVLHFLDKIFILIDSSALESIRMEQSDSDNIRSKMEAVAEALIQSSAHGILAQCSDDIKKAAARKVELFIKSHLFEPKVAGLLAGCLVRVMSRVSGDFFLRSIVPYLIETLEKYFSDHEDIASVEKQSDEVQYYLILLMNTMRGDPRFFVHYIDDIIPIIDQVSRFKCKLANKKAGSMILNIMSNVGTLQTLDIHSSPEIVTKPLAEFLPIRHWGEKMKPHDRIAWYMPDENCRKVCEKLIHRYLPPILEAFEKHVSGEITLDRDEILRDVSMVTSLIRCNNFLPVWTNEEPLKLVESAIDGYTANVTLGFDNLVINMPDGRNVRLAIIETLSKLQRKILECSEDDIKSLRAIVSLWDKVHISRHYNSAFDTQMKNYMATKSFQNYKLTMHRRNLRAVAAMRVLMQQDCRDELRRLRFTATHREIMLNLLTLSTSKYSTIRSLAQGRLFSLFALYAFSYRCILDELVPYLRLDSNEHHESFKGALYILNGQRRMRLIVKHDWECVEKLWLSLLQSKLSEKPSVVKLLDLAIDAINNEFPTLNIELTIPERCVEQALSILPSDVSLSVEDIEVGRVNLLSRNVENREKYENILNTIVQTVKDNSLHWRYNLMASLMIFNLVHPETKYPEIVARYVVNNLISDSLEERKIAVRTMTFIMTQQKREHKKITIDPFSISGTEPSTKLLPGYRQDNAWLQYDIERVPRSQSEWDEARFIHRGQGYFGWKPLFQLYASNAEQPPLDRDESEMNDTERVIYNFFSDADNVEKLVTFWSLEEKKGKDKFNRSRFFLMKSLSTSFGDAFVDSFLSHLPRLIAAKECESNHRCAAEIMAGLMKGTKHWTYEKTEKLFGRLQPLIREALSHVTNDTDAFWGTCFATAAEMIDPMRQYWLYEVLLEDPLRESTSFIDCSRIYCLQGPFNQHVWRMNTIAHRLLDYLRPYFVHPFQNVRERLGSILINIFEADLTYPGGNEPQSPRMKDFISGILPQLQILYNDYPKIVPKSKTDNADSQAAEEESSEESGEATKQVDTDFEVAVRLFKTISHWIIGVLNRTTNGNQPEYFELLPFACRLEKCEQDNELQVICTSLLAMLSQALTLPECMAASLAKINDVSRMSSWSARLAVVDVLQVLVFNNMSIVLSRLEWVDAVQEIVLRLLEDTVLEVREKAAQVLGGLLHCSFLPATDKLLELFKKKCRTKVVKSSRRVVATTSCAVEASIAEASLAESREANAVRVRHTGVLGLCAFISAYPYDIPDFVPDVFEHLGAHLNDPQPIPSTIRKTVGDFKRTHHDNWATHQLKFTEDQLAVLSDLTVPPSYYA
ncbi:proteasome activator complex subunit 4-like [Phlebotomus argentipes]|uniref:proteasome activator complex subunit 4-like n=1 Tax=Phlebotomus argentipes TaxID=94469 RepID=UPI0028935D22|nr:proteasome activator complex subunit 4-like [Phlebotomus argentipes]